MLRPGTIGAVLAACLLAAATGADAQSFKPFVIRDIRVEGLQRTEPGTVFSYLPVKVGETMNEEKAQQAMRALFATGFFQDVRLEVDSDVLVVTVQERPAIAQIDFTGLREFEPDNIRKALRELGIADGRIFDRSLLDTADQEIKRQYLSKGMYAAEVQVTVTPLERNRVGISIAVTEGEVAKIRGINIVGAQAFAEDDLVDLFVLRTPGWLTWYTKHDRYAREKLSADLETLRSYNKTRDEVVRREMRQLEGAFYDASKIQLSKRRIDRTQYFSEVGVETQPVEGTPDQVDVLYTVKEKPTGALLLGAGFSSVEKLVLSTSIQQTNAFGTGKFLAASINSGSVNKVYSLSYLDPYFTVDGVSQGFDVYRRKTDASRLSVGPYSTDALGGGVKFGYPISEKVSISFGLNAETVQLTTFDTSPQQYLNFVNTFGNNYQYGALTTGWAMDTRDSLIRPTDGNLSRVSSEFAGGDLQYYRFGYLHQYFYPLSRDYTLFLRADLGYAGGDGRQ